jgi:hypothetical protein
MRAWAFLLISFLACNLANGQNVGIGTGSPGARLDVISNSATSTTSAFMLRNSDGDTLFRVRNDGRVGIGYNGSIYGRPLSVQGNGINFYQNATIFGGAIFPDANNNLTLWTEFGDHSLILQPNWGQVTIGTSSPAAGYKLSVNGKMICTEARVQLNAAWPDYVFADDYPLPSLDELEIFIKKNRHLPKMPSAAAVQKENGFDLGEMQQKMLEKIEELTMYVIELKNENKMLQERLKKVEEKSFR